MTDPSLAKRLEMLKNDMRGPSGLFDRVGSLEVQLLEFRAEVRAEFSATRQDIRDLDTRVNRIEARIDLLEKNLREETRAGDEETRSVMRVLHEEVLARIATLKG